MFAEGFTGAIRRYRAVGCFQKKKNKFNSLRRRSLVFRSRRAVLSRPTDQSHTTTNPDEFERGNDRFFFFNDRDGGGP